MAKKNWMIIFLFLFSMISFMQKSKAVVVKAECEYTFAPGANQVVFKVTVERQTSVVMTPKDPKVEIVDGPLGIVNFSTVGTTLKYNDFVSGGSLYCNPNVKLKLRGVSTDDTYTLGLDFPGPLTLSNANLIEESGGGTTSPDPVDPNPVDPDPVDPDPVDPDPVDPNPVDPDPVDPGPGDGTYGDFMWCEDSGVIRVMKVIGTFLMIVKIVVPALLIVLGSIDFGKALIAGEDDSIKNSAVAFGKRLGLGIAIFLIPTIINLVIKLVDGVGNLDAEYSTCSECVFRLNCPE